MFHSSLDVKRDLVRVRVVAEWVGETVTGFEGDSRSRVAGRPPLTLLVGTRGYAYLLPEYPAKIAAVGESDRHRDLCNALVARL